MKPSERNDLIRSYFEQDMALLMAKGHDYAGNQDCLANLKRFGSYGIIVRLSDKFSRLETLTKAGGQAVLNESILDTIRDIRNYCFLLQIFLEGKHLDPEMSLFPGWSGGTDGASGLPASIKKIQAELNQIESLRPKYYQDEDEAKEFVDGGC